MVWAGTIAVAPWGGRGRPVMRMRIMMMIMMVSVMRPAATLPCPRCRPGAGGCEAGADLGDECFYRINGKQLTLNLKDDVLSLSCGGAVSSLEDPLLPSFPRPVTLSALSLSACPPPRAALPPALAALNVTLRREGARLDLTALPPAPAPPLSAAHLAGLPPLRVLKLGALSPAPAPCPLPPTRRLFLSRLQLSPDALLQLPPELEQLHVSGGGLQALPASALRRLPHLSLLTLDEPALRCPPELAAAPSLLAAVITAPLSAAPSLAGAKLQNLTLQLVKELRLPSGCGALQALVVRGSPDSVMRTRWMQAAGGGGGCPQLRRLALLDTALRAAEGGALTGAGGLRDLRLEGAAAAQGGAGRLWLSQDLFADVPLLTALSLRSNGLLNISSALLEPLIHLEQLDLSNNQLTSLPPRALPSPLVSLDLSHNPLGSLCDPRSPRSLSALHQLRSLRSLRLVHTAAAAVCSDWRDHMTRLELLDLAGNDITTIDVGESWPRRIAPLVVRLGRNPRLRPALRPDQYRRLRGEGGAEGEGSVQVTIKMDNILPCDCDDHWVSLALREGRLPLALSEPRCAGGASLRTIDLSALVCRPPCDPRCQCELRVGGPDAGPDLYTLDVRCVRANLTAPPTLPRPPLSRIALRLHLEHNLLTAATAVAVLSPAVRHLDLRHNAVRSLSPLLRVSPAPATLLLAGNPLSCHCEELPVVPPPPCLLDWTALRCEGGDPLPSAAQRCLTVGALPPEETLSADVMPWVAGGALLLGSALALAALGLRRGGERGEGNGSDQHKTHSKDEDEYDVFLSFSHHDAAVAEQLLTELERGGLRLCVHTRDWRAGDWIPGAIARSVRCSRATLVLLSGHFARSVWARAELREAAARGGTGRLVAVLLQDAAPPALDAELRRALHRAPHLTWGQRAFWGALRGALPPPRGGASGKGRPRPPPLQLPSTPTLSPPTALSPTLSPPTPVVKFESLEFPSSLQPAPCT